MFSSKLHCVVHVHSYRTQGCCMTGRGNSNSWVSTHSCQFLENLDIDANDIHNHIFPMDFPPAKGFLTQGFLWHENLKWYISSQSGWVGGGPAFLTQLLLPVSKGVQEVTKAAPTEKSRDFCLMIEKYGRRGKKSRISILKKKTFKN